MTTATCTEGSGVMRAAGIGIWVFLTGLLVGCGSAPSQRHASPIRVIPNHSLSVLYAGSMTKVMETTIRPHFEGATSYRMDGQGAGSNALAQLMRSGLKRADVFVSASPTVNHSLMGSANHNLVSWYLTLASDQLVIAYAPGSHFAKDLDAARKGTRAWYKVLAEPGIRFGRTDPALDPKGVNTLFMMQLANRFYNQKDLSERLLGAAENPKQVYPEETLLAQLATGQVDAAVAYKHEAVEWKLPYITLPAAINLGDVTESHQYASAVVRIGKTVQHGAPIVFTVAIPNNARHPQAASEFVQYLLSGQGHQFLMRDGFGHIPTYVGGSAKALPAALRSLARGSWPRDSKRSQS